MTVIRTILVCIVAALCLIAVASFAAVGCSPTQQATAQKVITQTVNGAERTCVVVDSFDTSTMNQPKRLAPMGAVVYVCQVVDAAIDGAAGSPSRPPLPSVAGSVP
jgi:p-aminobenzoyl-glutamate transporter AbgT